MASIGFRNWFPLENATFMNAQIGFKIMSASQSQVAATTAYTVNEDEVIMAIQNINTHNIEIQAKSLAGVRGDDLSTTGVYNVAALRWLTIYPEDIIYGHFETISLKKPTLSGAIDYVKLIKGVR